MPCPVSVRLLDEIKEISLAMDTPTNRKRLVVAVGDLLDTFGRNVGPDFFGEIGVDLVIQQGTIQRVQIALRRDRRE